MHKPNLAKLPIAFENDCPFYITYQSMITYSLALSTILLFANLINIKLYLLFILACIFLVITKIRHLFLSLLAFWVSSSLNCLFISFMRAWNIYFLRSSSVYIKSRISFSSFSIILVIFQVSVTVLAGNRMVVLFIKVK